MSDAPRSLEELRAGAAAHGREIMARRTFLTAADLAARWQCKPKSVLTIPADRLPFVAIGGGTKRLHRRYDPADVEQYERGRKRGVA